MIIFEGLGGPLGKGLALWAGVIHILQCTAETGNILVLSYKLLHNLKIFEMNS